mgnify:CR=1 FL=1
MKKVILLFLSVILLTKTQAQNSFMDVPVAGTISEATKKFKALGFSVVSDKDNYVTLEGKMGSTDIELNLVASPTTKTVWKFIVYLPKNDSWYSIKNEFNDYRKTLIAKYGEPSKDYNFFSSPYKEGDGYEMNALVLGKCTYFSFWNDNMVLSISKFKQISISYENPVNSKIDDDEKERIKQKSF